MNTKSRILVILAIMLGGALVAATFYAKSAVVMVDDKEEKGQIEWLSFDAALAKAKSEKKMMVVDFYTDWCSWCKVMDEKTYGNKEVIDFARKKLVMAKVNAESNTQATFMGKTMTYRELAMGFGVRGYPATVFLGPGGEFITNVGGYITPDKFMPILEFLEGKHYQTMKFEEFVAKRNK